MAALSRVPPLQKTENRSVGPWGRLMEVEALPVSPAPCATGGALPLFGCRLRGGVREPVRKNRIGQGLSID
jgi:hypothetical protein